MRITERSLVNKCVWGVPKLKKLFADIIIKGKKYSLVNNLNTVFNPIDTLGVF